MSKRKWYTKALYTIVALAMTVGLLMVPAVVASPAVTYYVDDDGSDANDGSTEALAWQTIDHALTTVSADDTIIVLPGLYDTANGEAFPLVIGDDNVTLKSRDGAATTTIGDAAATDKNTIEITGAGVTLGGTDCGFTLTGDPEFDTYTGIVVLKGDNATVQDNIITGDYPHGIYAHPDLTGDVVYKMTIKDNIITSTTPANNFGGIFVFLGAGSVIDNNDISNCGDGISLYGGAGATTSGSWLTPITVSNNVCYDNIYAGIGLDAGWTGQHITGLYYVDVSGNDCSSNVYGICMCGAALDEIKIVGNDIYDNTNTGIHLDSSVGYPGHVYVRCNNIYGNTSYGLNNAASANGTVPAAKNYWGDESGPYNGTTNPLGLGDRVSDYVVYEPWAKTLVAATVDTPVYLVPDYLYTTGLDDWEEIDIAYNVKTAEETFTVVDVNGAPVNGALVSDWSVTKGCGAGDVTILDGGEDGDNFIKVVMDVKGDAMIRVWVDIDCDCDRDEQVSAEKKWGEIYCTDLDSEKIVEGEYDVTETVLASFLWEDCIIELELPADGAVVDWWLMDIDALAAVEALELALGDDPCDVDGGCGTYKPDFFEYDIDGEDGIEADEEFDSPREALLAMYAEATYVVGAGNEITDPTVDADLRHEQTESDVDGKTTVEVTLTAPTSAILVTLTDYPEDKHGQNTVCVQHETWVVIPPPEHEKLPDIVWAGEKDVVEWRLSSGYIDYLVCFYLQHPSVGSFIGTTVPTDPDAAVPYPGFALAATAWAIVEPVDCPLEDGAYGAARVVVESNYEGKAVVKAALLPYEWNGSSWDEVADGEILILNNEGFEVFFLAFESVELVNLDKDVDNDEAWEEAGETTGVLDVDDESLLRLRVKGFFTDEKHLSGRDREEIDWDSDGDIDYVLPADRWVIPDDYPRLALGKSLWDMMDTPIDDIVSWLDEDGDQVETLGPYGEAACFESVLFDDDLSLTEQKEAFEEALVSGYPVIGPFSKLEPPDRDGVGWELCDFDWDGTDLLFWPAVPGDLHQVDDLEDADEVEIFASCRTTVVPDGIITVEDANMPPAEILFVVTDGAGDLTDVNKAELYYRDAECVFGTDSVDGEVYTNPYYWQEIPASPIIPPEYSSGLEGYEWDSWDLDGDNPDIRGPYRFYDRLDVWAADRFAAADILDLDASEEYEMLKVYTDNRGEAWVEFEQESLLGSMIEAIACYPYQYGNYPYMASNEVIKESEELKDINVAWERIDDMYDMLYVFVRDYDGDPAVCEPVEWKNDGIAGTIISLLEDTAGPCDNECLDITCEGFIAADGRSAESCTREMTTAEITKFAAAEITVPLDRFHREIVATGGEPLFGVGEDPEDYAIAGIMVSSSLGDDVDIIIKIHNCWKGDEVVKDEDQILYFGVAPPEVEWSFDAPEYPASLMRVYPGGTTVDLDAITGVPAEILGVYGETAGEWSFFIPTWTPAENTLHELVPGTPYLIQISGACTWEIAG